MLPWRNNLLFGTPPASNSSLSPAHPDLLHCLITVDGFTFVCTNFRRLSENLTLVGFKICGHSVFLHYTYRKSLFRGHWNSWIGPSTKTTKNWYPMNIKPSTVFTNTFQLEVLESVIRPCHPGETIFHSDLHQHLFDSSVSPAQCGFSPGNSYIDTYLHSLQPGDVLFKG